MNAQLEALIAAMGPEERARFDDTFGYIMGTSDRAIQERQAYEERKAEEARLVAKRLAQIKRKQAKEAKAYAALYEAHQRQREEDARQWVEREAQRAAERERWSDMSLPRFGPGAKVRLTTDLTQYHPSLVAGVEGIQLDWHAYLGDRFTTVRFPQHTLPILYKSLELVEGILIT
jgi:hypothetical protein